MLISAPIYKLKRQAKLTARERGIPLHAALDDIAAREGFKSWSHLAHSVGNAPAENILRRLEPGDMMLLGARPGHGKTLLGLELALAAAKTGRPSYFFTLDYTTGDVGALVRDLGGKSDGRVSGFIVDTSDDISAAYIAETVDRDVGAPLIVIDYLQLLDQKRTNPVLGEQVRALRSFAQSTGATIVAISQIDRAFDLTAESMPGLSDVRLPNPADLGVFDKTCFLHDGAIAFNAAA